MFSLLTCDNKTLKLYLLEMSQQHKCNVQFRRGLLHLVQIAANQEKALKKIMPRQMAHQHTQNLRKIGSDATSTNFKLAISQIMRPKKKHLTQSFSYTLERPDISNEKSSFKVPHFPLNFHKYKIISCVTCRYFLLNAIYLRHIFWHNKGSFFCYTLLKHRI